MGHSAPQDPPTWALWGHDQIRGGTQHGAPYLNSEILLRSNDVTSNRLRTGNRASNWRAAFAPSSARSSGGLSGQSNGRREGPCRHSSGVDAGRSEAAPPSAGPFALWAGPFPGRKHDLVRSGHRPMLLIRGGLGLPIGFAPVSVQGPSAEWFQARRARGLSKSGTNPSTLGSDDERGMSRGRSMPHDRRESNRPAGIAQWRDLIWSHPFA
jgi:hypothetical protein